MVTFLVRRITFLLITLVFVSIAIFMVTELAPGNIAVNTLGMTITPEQEASFNAQNGLNEPATTRYVRWLLGSDWRASNRIGRPVQRVRNGQGSLSWWVVAEDGTLFQTSTDGEQLFRRVLIDPVETIFEDEIIDSADAWTTNEQGVEVFWGIDHGNRGAMWVRGNVSEELTLGPAGWQASTGAPADYIPLQRGLLRGDPGFSLKDRAPVAEVLPRRAANTAILAGTAFVIVMPLALLLGLIAGLNEGKLIDRIFSISSLIATATPEFASGVFLILIFTVWLGWFPGAVVITSEDALFQNPDMLVLPILTLTLLELGYVLRITRASMVEVMRTNYIRTAVLKGLPQRRIVFKHALRNALLAPITIIMLHVNWLIGGIVIVETLFGFPGLGRYVLEAALFKDVFAIEASAMLLVIIAVATQLGADVLYTFLNPRIRYS
ncbi:MAG: ABC transporter permease [Candidatus Promineifilaceae bacterium]